MLHWSSVIGHWLGVENPLLIGPSLPPTIVGTYLMIDAEIVCGQYEAPKLSLDSAWSRTTYSSHIRPLTAWSSTSVILWPVVKYPAAGQCSGSMY